MIWYGMIYDMIWYDMTLYNDNNDNNNNIIVIVMHNHDTQGYR